MKIVESLEDSGLLIKSVLFISKTEAKVQKCSFIDVLLGTLGTSLLGNMLAEKGVLRGGEGLIRVSEGTNRADWDFQCCLIL